MKTLILTEKPSVARDFAKALAVQGKKEGYLEDNRFIITWALGHLVELLEPEDYDPKWKKWNLESLPILPAEFAYKPIEKTQRQLNIIKKLLSQKDVEKVVVATDAGREGEVIARTVLLHSDFRDRKKIQRFWTSQALTPQVVREGMASLADAGSYDRLWQAGQARQIADWLVGMNCSRAATVKMKDLFSVGRVQTAVLALLADRRKERENFKPEPYWMLRAFFANDKGRWRGTWFKGKENRFDKEEKAKEIQEKITGQTGFVKKVTKQKKKQAPPLLFSLTELQREANTRFGFTAAKTLETAQALYEERKCLSYPRTDSQVLGTKNVSMTQQIAKKLSSSYPNIFAGLEEKLIQVSNKRVFNDAKLTDHHALIPLAPLPQNAKNEEKKLYDLVLKRFAAAFYPDCEFEETEIITEVLKESFRTKGKIILKQGWKSVYGDTDKKTKKEDEDEEADELPALVKDDPARVTDSRMEKKMTQPPPEYTEALLLKDMSSPGKYVSEEELKKIYRGETGLGTQATRAQIIETLLSRKYAQREKRHLIATDKGCRLVNTLRTLKTAAILTSPEETARWEMQLNRIAQGQESDKSFLEGIRNFIQQTVGEFHQMTEQMAKIQDMGTCPVCGGKIIEWKRGFGCSNWRKEDGECRFVVWKIISGKILPPSVIAELITKKEAGPIAGFADENDRPFSAKLRLAEENGAWQVKLETVETPPENRPPSSDVIGQCPACGGNVRETQRAYGCANWREADGGCKFTIWKEMAKKLITPDMAKKLLQGEKIGPLDNFISKKGNPFSASLKVMQENGRWDVKFVFEDNPAPAQPGADSGNGVNTANSEKIFLGHCPSCGGEIVEKPKGYGCANWRDADGGCKFVIWKNMAQKEISPQVAAQLLKDGITDVLFGFLSKKGNAFSARLKLAEDENGQYKVGFDFPDDRSHS
ncbi:MAG: DNA topoisomerase 3 [Desulfobacterales bacterium]